MPPEASRLDDHDREGDGEPVTTGGASDRGAAAPRHVRLRGQGLRRAGAAPCQSRPRAVVPTAAGKRRRLLRRQKGRKTCLILDCRASNRLFVPPLGVSLLSAEGLGRVEFDVLESSEMDDLALGISDVQNCFNRLLFGTKGVVAELVHDAIAQGTNKIFLGDRHA